MDSRDAAKLCDFGVSHTYGNSLGGRDGDSGAFDRNVYGADRAKRLREIGRAKSAA